MEFLPSTLYYLKYYFLKLKSISSIVLNFISKYQLLLSFGFAPWHGQYLLQSSYLSENILSVFLTIKSPKFSKQSKALKSLWSPRENSVTKNISMLCQRWDDRIFRWTQDNSNVATQNISRCKVQQRKWESWIPSLTPVYSHHILKKDHLETSPSSNPAC